MITSEDGATKNIFLDVSRARHYAAAVHRAFCDVPLPHPPFVRDPRAEDLKILRLLEGQAWWVLPPVVLYVWRVDFSVLDVEPYVYFLPAFLVQSVLADEYDLSAWTFNRLIPPSEGEVGSRFMNMAASFNAEQCQLILLFARDFLEVNWHVAESADNRAARTLEFWTSRSDALK
ncbi:MAG: hypothetical protein IPM16_00125 [Chloroflexi bacterium]|nr:hypothetical protein [Chloroflexota bacterium]